MNNIKKSLFGTWLNIKYVSRNQQFGKLMHMHQQKEINSPSKKPAITAHNYQAKLDRNSLRVRYEINQN